MKHIFFFLIFSCACVCTSYGQFENSTWQQRMGHGKDSVQNMEQQQVWSPYLQANGMLAYQHPQDAKNPNAFEQFPRTWDAKSYKAWRLLTRNAPFSQFSLYASGSAGDMLRYLMFKENDKAVKLIYFDNLMEICDFRIDNLAALNSIRANDFGPQKINTMADVKTWKAHYYYTEGKIFPKTVYSEETAYKYFTDAMKAVREQKSVKGTEVEAYLIEEYFNSCYELYQTNPDKYRVQFLTDYQDCHNTLKRLYETARDIQDVNQAEGQFYTYYNELTQFVQPLYNSTKAGDPDSLDAYFKKHFEEHRSDIDYINTAIALMVENGCLPTIDTPRIIERYAEIAWQHPEKLTYFSALAYGLKLHKDATLCFGDEKEQKRSEMKNAFTKAFAQATTNSEKAEISFQIGKALNQKLDPLLADNKDEVSRWKNDMEGVIKYLEDAITYDPDHYSCVSNFYLELVHFRIMNAYLNQKYFDQFEQDEKYALRKEQLEEANASITCANHAISEGNKAMNNRVYEQDGTNIRNIMVNAKNNAPEATAQSISKSLKQYDNYYNAASRRTSASHQTGGIDPNWHMNVWHPYLTKKGKEKAFWTGRGERCQYCGREFK